MPKQNEIWWETVAYCLCDPLEQPTPPSRRSEGDRAHTKLSRHLFIYHLVFHAPFYDPQISSTSSSKTTQSCRRKENKLVDNFSLLESATLSARKIGRCQWKEENRQQQTAHKKNCNKLYDAEVNVIRRRTAAKDATNLNDSFVRNTSTAQNESSWRYDDWEHATKLL